MLVYSFIAILVFKSGEPYFPVFVFIGLNCWHELPETQTEEDGFLVVSDFLVDFDFDENHPFIMQLDLTIFSFCVIIRVNTIWKECLI